MSPTIPPKPKWWIPGLCCLFFFFTGLALLHYPGLHNDELLFADLVYSPSYAAFAIKIRPHEVPLMIMGYLGTLKTLLYAPILKVFQPSYLSIRVPVLILGSLTVWILFRWLAMVHGRRAAWIGALLLATDTTFLLTTCFDWGPVALQHFLTLLGVMLVAHFHHHRKLGALAGGFFCFGLAAWDKALFAWIFSGLAIAVVLVFPDLLRRHFSWKNGLVAALCMIAGASPLIAYNLLEQFPTFHTTSGFSARELYPKTYVARATWEGVALFGYLVREDTDSNPRGPSNLLEEASFRLRGLAGEHRRNALNWAAFAALALLLPSMWWPAARRLVLFCLIAIAVAWLQMGVTRGAGGAAHHVVLLWPFPHVILAVLFAELWQRLDTTRWAAIGNGLLGAGITLLVVWNVLVTNQYLYQFARNGAANSWTDAIGALGADLHRMHRTQPAKIRIFDWGILVPLVVLDRGRLPLVWGGDSFDLTLDGRLLNSPASAVLQSPDTLWLGHTDTQELFIGTNSRVATYIRAAGLEKLPVRTYYDSNGRAVFESFRLGKK